MLSSEKFIKTFWEMKLERIKISNFRMLKEVELSFEDTVTLIVGRNNAGKTSVTEFFHRILSSSNPKFQLEDFSVQALQQFKTGFEMLRNEKEAEDIARVLPLIEAQFHFSYNPSEDIGALSVLVIDLDADCCTAIATIKFYADSNSIQNLYQPVFDQGTDFNSDKSWRALKVGISQSYATQFSANDPTNSNNNVFLPVSELHRILLGSFISAQRGLDGGNIGADRNVLGKMLEGLFAASASSNTPQNQKNIIINLENAVSQIQSGLDSDFSAEVAKLLPTMKDFGYPGTTQSEFKTETTLDIGRLLSNNTRVLYATKQGIGLPENHNGLGTRNLVYILIQMLAFFREYKSKLNEPATHLIFIEEPEAHLHPQMQEVFIRQLGLLAEKFEREFNDGKKWPVQIVVTTHSSHIANEVPFEWIRYFRPIGRIDLTTEIRDLREALKQILPHDKDDHITFLRKYFTLTKCDLFFADKAILIEGPSERLMLPELARKIDKKAKEHPYQKAKNAAEFDLQSQYISTIEINGAYAYKFIPIIDFLGIKTLIITDIDSIDNGKKALPQSASRTSNTTLKNWFDNNEITMIDLWNKDDSEKINAAVRITYQLHELNCDLCGRSFEEAFILANRRKFGIPEDDNERTAKAVMEKAKGQKKLDFAIQYGVDDLDWSIPRYLDEALMWIRSDRMDHPITQEKRKIVEKNHESLA